MKCTGVFRRTESACAAEVAGRPLCDGGATVQRQADIVAVHPCGAYVFELKVDESADAALEQVKSKGYDVPYRGGNAPVWLVGLSFDGKTHRLLDAKVERL